MMIIGGSGSGRRLDIRGSSVAQRLCQRYRLSIIESDSHKVDKGFTSF